MRFVLSAIYLTDAGGKFSWKQLERDLQLAADGTSAPAASVASAGAAGDEDSELADGVHRMRIG